MKERTPALQRALESPNSSNSWVDYFLAFEMKLDELNGHILDIGSGKSDFGNKLMKMKEDAFVVRLNPHLVRPDHGTELDPESNSPQVAALVQEGLPFPDECFDFVFSLHAVPKFIHGYEVEPMFEEVWRVLKKGGVGYFYPFAHLGESVTRFRNIHNSIAVEPIKEFLVPKDKTDDKRYTSRIVMRK